MHLSENAKYALATAGVLLLGAGMALMLYGDDIRNTLAPVTLKAVHVHADFSFYIADKRIDLTDLQYQSSSESVKHPTMHFHDGVDTMLHRHAEGVTLGDFMNSIGLQLTDTCITLSTKETYCSDESNALALYVNGTVVTDAPSYVVQEEDRILLYYGDIASANITEYMANITDEACIYSGNCPERGEPPFESCGITCEITQ